MAIVLLLASRASNAVELPPKSRVEIERLTTSTKSYLMHSPELGWTLRPSASAKDRGYYSNIAGLRGRAEYALRPASGTLRAAAFGDSFVHGDDVAEKETWEAAASALDGRIEILNYGVPAYGLDQALLRYRHEGSRFHPRIVIIGFMTKSLHRNLMTFRPYWNPTAGLPFAKPRFILDGKKLKLIPNPLPSLDDYRALLADAGAEFPALGAHDDYYRNSAGSVEGGFRSGTDSFELAVRLLAAFHEEVRRSGQVPLILVFPERRHLTERREGLKPYGPLLQALRARGLDHLDAGEALAAAAAPVDSLYVPSNHLSAEGNRVVARALVERLRDMGL